MLSVWRNLWGCAGLGSAVGAEAGPGSLCSGGHDDGVVSAPEERTAESCECDDSRTGDRSSGVMSDSTGDAETPPGLPVESAAGAGRLEELFNPLMEDIEELDMSSVLRRRYWESCKNTTPHNTRARVSEPCLPRPTRPHTSTRPAAHRMYRKQVQPLVYAQQPTCRRPSATSRSRS